VKIYMDDVRPTPPGWIRTYGYADTVAFLRRIRPEHVTTLSLDHDLGMACETCLTFDSKTDTTTQTCGRDMWHDVENVGGEPRGRCKHDCTCHMTGYDVVCWMEQRGWWPPNRPTVHSINPAGRARMEQVISKHYGGTRG
jgi:hypothetical protein